MTHELHHPCNVHVVHVAVSGAPGEVPVEVEISKNPALSGRTKLHLAFALPAEVPGQSGVDVPPLPRDVHLHLIVLQGRIVLGVPRPGHSHLHLQHLSAIAWKGHFRLC